MQQRCSMRQLDDFLLAEDHPMVRDARRAAENLPIPSHNPNSAKTKAISADSAGPSKPESSEGKTEEFLTKMRDEAMKEGEKTKMGDEGKQEGQEGAKGKEKSQRRGRERLAGRTGMLA